VSTSQFFSLVLGCALANVIRAYWARYQAWKGDPNRVKTARKNWRGVYVADLGLQRAERAIFWGWGLFTLACIPVSAEALAPGLPGLIADKIGASLHP